MKLYEIDDEIERLWDAVDIDEETGEVAEGAEELLEKIRALRMERKSVLSWLAKLALNARAEEAALKNEERRLKNRRERLLKKESRLMEVLDRECAGEKTDLGVATVSYRKTSRLEVSDAESAVRWLGENGHDGCYRVPAPEVAKAEVKRLINTGAEVPGCSVIEGYSCVLR